MIRTIRAITVLALLTFTPLLYFPEANGLKSNTKAGPSRDSAVGREPGALIPG